MKSNDKTLINIKNLSFSYKKEEVLHNINVSFGSETVGIVGHNGAGKTTILNLILGTLKTRHDEISLHIKQSDILSIFDNGGLYPDFTLKENIIFRNKLFSDRIDRKIDVNELRNNEIIIKFALKKYIDKPVKEYSTGIYKRAQIAIGLMFQPKYILFDEPTNGIDPITLEMFKKLLVELKNDKVYFIFVSHDLRICYDLLDRVIMLNDGEIVADIKPDEVGSFEEFCDIYKARSSDDDSNTESR